MDMPRIARTIAWVIAGGVLGCSLATAKGVAPKERPGAALVEVEGKLLEYQEKHPWCTYAPGAETHAMGESPWGRFEITSPALHAGRSFGVLFTCSGQEGLLRALRSGAGHLFVLVVPQDFLQGKYSELEDCSIDSTAMKRWKPAAADSKAR
jgi:hypothetical protein